MNLKIGHIDQIIGMKKPNWDSIKIPKEWVFGIKFIRKKIYGALKGQELCIIS
jgi:hypothetical protein